MDSHLLPQTLSQSLMHPSLGQSRAHEAAFEAKLIDEKEHHMDCNDEEEEFKSLMGLNEESSASNQAGDAKRISSSSRVNFTKLNKKEQAARFKNMQKKIQRLQIQVRSLKIHNQQLRDKLKSARKPSQQSSENAMLHQNNNMTGKGTIGITNSIGGGASASVNVKYGENGQAMNSRMGQSGYNDCIKAGVDQSRTNMAPISSGNIEQHHYPINRANMIQSEKEFFSQNENRDQIHPQPNSHSGTGGDHKHSTIKSSFQHEDKAPSHTGPHYTHSKMNLPCNETQYVPQFYKCGVVPQQQQQYYMIAPDYVSTPLGNSQHHIQYAAASAPDRMPGQPSSAYPIECECCVGQPVYYGAPTAPIYAGKSHITHQHGHVYQYAQNGVIPSQYQHAHAHPTYQFSGEKLPSGQVRNDAQTNLSQNGQDGQQSKSNMAIDQKLTSEAIQIAGKSDAEQRATTQVRQDEAYQVSNSLGNDRHQIVQPTFFKQGALYAGNPALQTIPHLTTSGNGASPQQESSSSNTNTLAISQRGVPSSVHQQQTSAFTKKSEENLAQHFSFKQPIKHLYENPKNHVATGYMLPTHLVYNNSNLQSYSIPPQNGFITTTNIQNRVLPPQQYTQNLYATAPSSGSSFAPAK